MADSDDCRAWAGARRVLISLNPTAGPNPSQARVETLVLCLKQAGFFPEVLTDLDQAAQQANQRHARGELRALVGVGGDGTAAELVNRTVPGLPITLLPAGNENLLARYACLQAAPEALCQTIGAGTLVKFDAGRAGGRIFLLMLSCGLDAEVVRRVHALRQGHICRRDYYKPMWQAIRNYSYPELHVDRETDDDAAPPGRLQARWLFVFNLPCYGGGFRIAPQANGCDGLLDLCALRRGSLWHGLRYAAAVRLGCHQRLADWSACRARRLRVHCEIAVPYQLDGDPGGWLPVDVEVLPGRFSLLIPATRAAELQMAAAAASSAF